MINPPKRYLVTSALPYANGPLHIGHLTGAYLPADIYVRMHRMLDNDVAFICGSDEHGAAITIKALKEGSTPQEIIDKYHSLFQETFKKAGISFDIYHRTSSPVHHETSQDFFRSLYSQGQFVEEESEQYYDEQAEKFLADRYIKGTCPNCKNPDAYGDQCEKCGTSLSPLDLIDPVSTITGTKPVLRKTKHWYLPLDKYEGWLREYVEKGILDGKEHHDPADWKSHVIGQCKSWLDGGLQPRAMTRDLDWGVDVPQEIPGAAGKKLYVWMDAPIGYVSATKQWAADNGKDWKEYWQDPDSSLIHFIGKDNIVFHCLIFPAILKAEGHYNLPVNVPANQFLNLEEQKISTSRNWAIWVHEFLHDHPDHVDALRYVLTKNMPEQKDAEFTWKGYQSDVNADLVGTLANFVHRTMVLTHKFYEGKIPAFDEDTPIVGTRGNDEASWHEVEMMDLFDRMWTVQDAISKFNFREGLRAMLDIAVAGNQLLQFNEPWKAIKEEPETVSAVLNLSLQYANGLSLAMYPFMPEASARLRKLLSLEPIAERGAWVEFMDALANGENALVAGHVLSQPEHLFGRVEDEWIQIQINKLQESLPASENAQKTDVAPGKPPISYEDFAKMDIRTAKIITAEAVPKADKLLKLTLDVNGKERTVVSGIAEHYKPEDLPGKHIVILANLEPRKIRGVQSEGMILMAEAGDGRLHFIQAGSDESGMNIS
ncbi:MAG TPA: methionine--tRNA ligase [Saprospiraceae bacterium]|nr:methionine--tRNA ligase [Saprospiraceae bacterium]